MEKNTDSDQNIEARTEIESTDPQTLTLRPGLDIDTWDEMVDQVKALMRGTCTLVPILDDPINPMIREFNIPLEVLDSMFVPIQAKIGPNMNKTPYCVVSHVFERDGHTCHIDEAHRVVPHRTLNNTIVPIFGNQLEDGIIRHDKDNQMPMTFVMTYHPIMDDPFAQRALNLLYPLHVCFEVFVTILRLGGDLNEIPNTVMGLTGVDIQKEVADLLVDVSNHRAANGE